jgi:hypothetical protein
MIDTGTVIAIVSAGASCAAIFKFWMDQGAARASVERTEKKLDIVTEDLARFKLYVANEFPSASDFTALEGRFTEAVEGMREDIRHMRTGMDTLVTTFLNMK